MCLRLKLHLRHHILQMILLIGRSRMLIFLLACRTEEIVAEDTAGTDQSQAFECSSENPTIQSTTGCIEGLSIGGLSMFLGIPYAEPPIGTLRWKRPVPITPSDEIQKAVSLSSPCVQSDNYGGIFGSEDCLSLNIFRPQEVNEALPILFFTHGGSFTSGMGSTSVLEAPPQLATKAILVTHNYRLGPFGFLAHPDMSAEDQAEHEYGTSGNLGLLDTLTALKWVYDNAETLGGNPENIMIFGESAGAISTCALLLMTEAEGLFSSALLQSGACTSISTPQEYAQQQGIAYENLLDCSSSDNPLDCMRDSSASEIMSIDASTMMEFGDSFGPNVDGVYIPQSSGDMLYAGDFHRVPIAAGINKDEGSMFVHSLGLENAEELEQTLSSYGLFWGFSDFETLFSLYSIEEFGSAQAAMDQFYGDLIFVCPTRLSLDMISYYTNAFGYYYSHEPSWLSQYPELDGWGSYHSSELTFVFGTYLSFLTQEEQTFSEQIMQTWVNFAKNDYSTGTQSEWTIYQPQLSTVSNNRQWLSLASNDFQMISGIHKDRCDFMMTQWFE